MYHEKVREFEWKMLHDKLATRNALILRGLLDSNRDNYCVFYQHLFFKCSFSCFQFEAVFGIGWGLKDQLD